METILPAAARAALVFEEKILPNGLAIRLVPMPSYGAVHAIYATGFGSIDRIFEHAGKKQTLPAGVAHFLEHKMFENEDGVDAFSLYGQTGASANAYTGFDRTSYIFTATSEIERNLDILLSFVSNPYFTKQTVQKEQGIIAQEIKMYEDYAELRCVYALLKCLYHQHPVRDDIAGTVESIAEITPEMLYTCSNAFYTPSNMALCAAGNITMEELVAAVERAGLPEVKAEAAKRIYPAEEATIAQKEDTLHMSVAMPMFGLGFKEAAHTGDTTKLEVVCDFLTELLCGESSTLYRRLYDEGLVQPGFSGEYGLFADCLYFMFTGEGPDPARVREEVTKEIRRQCREGIDIEQFNTCKKMMYGDAIAGLENVERVASSLSSSYFRRRTPEKELEALAAVTPEDVQAALEGMLQEEKSAFVTVDPVM